VHGRMQIKIGLRHGGDSPVHGRDPLPQEQNLSVCHNAVFRFKVLRLRTRRHRGCMCDTRTRQETRGFRCVRQIEAVTSRRRLTRRLVKLTREADPGGSHRHPPLVACIAHLKEGAGLTSILKTQCPSVFDI